MGITLPELLKLLPTFISLIISAFALKSGWIFTKDKIFTSRKNASEFAYTLYKNTDNPLFKDLATDFGIAALTKDKNLTKKQREILLKSNDPVNDIDNFIKCQSIISINNEQEVFNWKKLRYRFWIYRKTIELITMISYFFGATLIGLPFLYNDLTKIIYTFDVNKLTNLQKFGITIFVVVFGFVICFRCLHKLSTIFLAEKTIKSNRISNRDSL